MLVIPDFSSELQVAIFICLFNFFTWMSTGSSNGICPKEMFSFLPHKSASALDFPSHQTYSFSGQKWRSHLLLPSFPHHLPSPPAITIQARSINFTSEIYLDPNHSLHLHHYCLCPHLHLPCPGLLTQFVNGSLSFQFAPSTPLLSQSTFQLADG